MYQLFHAELWSLPCLERLNIADNRISSLPPDIIRCQSLTRLTADSNQFSSLPPQLFLLTNLQQASFCGSRLTSLPNKVVATAQTQLKQLYVDSNPSLKSIPESLLFVGKLGVYECGAHMIRREMDKAVTVCAFESNVPSLMELGARALYKSLQGACCIDTLLPEVSLYMAILCPYNQLLCSLCTDADSVGLCASHERWLPNQLCHLLALPLSLSVWLIPSGLCSVAQCRKPFFRHFCTKRMSIAYYRQHLGSCFYEHDSRLEHDGDLAICVDVCSHNCLMSM